MLLAEQIGKSLDHVPNEGGQNLFGWRRSELVAFPSVSRVDRFVWPAIVAAVSAVRFDS